MKVELNHAAIRRLLRSSEVQEDLKKRAERVAAEAGPGYEVLGPHVGRNRAVVTVAPATEEARLAEARDHKLLSALREARRV
jgi:hypothetical protein